MPIRSAAFTATIVCVFLLTACGGAGGRSGQSLLQAQQPAAGQAAAPQPGQPAAAIPLPALDSIRLEDAPVRSGSYVDSDLLHEGVEYEAGLPHSHVSQQGASLMFSPDLSNPDNPGIAYAIYRYTVPDYDRAPEFRIQYDQGFESSNFWLALANWETRRWDLFSPTDFEKFLVGNLEPYMDLSGNLLAAVIVWGEPELLLGALRMGPYPPVPVIMADPKVGDTPLSVTLDASASDPVEGSGLEFHWDTDGDGVFETDTGAVSMLNAEYPENGVWSPAVMVVNEAGVSAVASTDVTAYGTWFHTWGRSELDEYSGVIGAADGSVYACGTSDQPGPGVDYDGLLAHWSADGQLLWTKRFDTGGDDLYHAIAQDGSGDIIVCGQTGSGPDVDMLVQKFDADGSTIWGRSFGGAKFDRCEQVLADGGDIYLAGQTDSLGATNDVFLMKLDSDGAVQWQAARDQAGTSDQLADMAGSYSLIGGLSGLVVLCESSAAGTPNVWKLVYGSSGSFSSGQLMQGSQYPKTDFSLVHNRNVFNNEVHNYIAGHIVYEGNPGLFLSDTDGTGAAVDFRFMPDLPSDHCAMIDNGDGNLLLMATGNADGDGLTDICLYFFTKTLAHLDSVSLLNAGGTMRGTGLAPYRQGVLACGYAPDISFTVKLPSISAQILNVGFDDADGNAVAINWPAQPLVGIFDEVAQQGVLDTGAGGNDALLMYLIP
ncbi:hypothetical protein KDL30_08350 [bacterium]|nr:hypothetical protein [bacterium]